MGHPDDPIRAEVMAGKEQVREGGKGGALPHTPAGIASLHPRIFFRRKTKTSGCRGESPAGVWGGAPSFPTLLFFLFLSLSLSTPALAQDDPTDEVDHVALAAQLVGDGHFDRARSVLVGVEPTKEQAADYHTVMGLVALDAQEFEGAVKHLDAAIFAGKTDDSMFVYLAQAHWGLQDWEKVVQMVRNAGDAAKKSAPLQRMRGQALWKLGRVDDAYAVFSAGAEEHPDDLQFGRLAIFALVELGLYRAAEERATDFLARGDATVDDFVAFGQALTSNRQTDRAIALMERARLQYPGDARIVRVLAAAWAADGKFLAAGDLLQRASESDPALLVEAAEMLRRGGAVERALYLNAQISDQKAKFRQRVAILTDGRDFEAVAAMADRLARLGLFADQNVLYAVAYARFQIGDYDGAEQLLKRIEDPAAFESATKLRQVMAYCSKNPC